MTNQHQTKAQLSAEVTQLRERVAELETVQAALRESEEKYRTLVETTGTGFVIIGNQGRVLDANLEYVRLTGHTSLEEIVGRNVIEWTAAYEIDKNVAAISQCMRDGYIQNLEIDYVKVSGAIIPIEINATVLRSGDAIQILTLCRDITDRRRTEAALRASELKYRSLIENSSDVVFCVNDQGEYQFTNRVFATTFGKTPDYFIGKTWWDIYPKEEADYRQAASQRMFETGVTQSVEVAVPLPDKTLYFIAKANPIKDDAGTVILNLTTAIDITERKQMEEALRESEVKLRAILDATPFPIALVDLQDNNIDFWSRSALTLFGHTAPTATEWYQIAYPDPDYRREVIDRWKVSLEKARLSAQAVNTGEYRVVCRNGSVRICELYATITADNLIVTFNDITERKQAEEALRERERTWATLISNLPGFVYRSANDHDWTMEYISEGCRGITGYAPEDFLQNRTLAYNDIIRTDYQGPLWQKWLEALPRQEAFEEEYPILTASGETRWVWERGRGIYAEDGRMLYLEGFITDITARKRAEAALRQSEDKFSKAFQTSPYAITITRPEDGKFIEVNDTFTAMTGFTREEALAGSSVGLTLWVNAEDRQCVVAALRAGQSVVGQEYPFRTKSGKVITGLFSAQALQLSHGPCILSSINDITERKRAEETLRASEERYRNIFNNSVEGIYQTTPAGRYRTVNPAFAHMFGYESPEEMINTVTNIGEQLYVHPEDRKRLVALLSASDGMVRDFEVQLIRKDGSLFWVSINARMIQSGKGTAPFIEGTCMDITEHKQAEEQINSLARFSAENPNPVLRLRPDGAILYANEASRAILQDWGCAVGDDAPPVWRAVVAAAFAERASKYMDVESAGRVWSFFVTPIIEAGYINLYGRDITDRKQAEAKIKKLNAELEQRVVERTAQFQAANKQLESEIAERKRAEEALQESEERLRRLSEAAFEAIIIHEGGVLLSSNDQYPEMFGYELKELLGKQVMPLTIAPESIEFVKKEIATGSVGPYESIGLRKDGTKFPMEIRVREMEYGERKVRVAAIMDITERKRAEAALQQRTTLLEAANQELEAFAYSVSHDLRSPLRAIDGFARILVEDYADKLDAEGHRVLNVVRANAQKMDQLITGLLTLSRVTRGEIQFARVDMTALAQTVYREIASPETQAAFTFSVAPLPAALGDPTLLGQVWSNLIGNAIKYTLPQTERRIEIGGRSENGLNVYYVKDSGVGFNPDYTAKLFGVFQRLHKVEEFEGTGVGLAIVQRIVHRHGGRVWAEGSLNQGATFYFALPGIARVLAG